MRTFERNGSRKWRDRQPPITKRVPTCGECINHHLGIIPCEEKKFCLYRGRVD